MKKEMLPVLVAKFHSSVVETVALDVDRVGKKFEPL